MHQFAPGEELALIQRILAGDHEAFRPLVVAYEGRLLAYLSQMLGNTENAHDLAQETFLALFRSLSRWHVPVSTTDHDQSRQLLAPWLYRIATNLALSLLRKQQVRKRIHAPFSTDTDDDGKIERYLSQSKVQQSFEEQYIAREMIRQALAHLSDIDAACMILHFVEGERYAEVGARLGLSSEAVRKRVHRALPLLRKVYSTLDTEVHS